MIKKIYTTLVLAFMLAPQPTYPVSPEEFLTAITASSTATAICGTSALAIGVTAGIAGTTAYTVYSELEKRKAAVYKESIESINRKNLSK